MTIKKFNSQTLNAALGDLPLGGIRFYQTVGSTNDLAITWAGQNAPDLSVVVSNEQSSGRGRNGRKWYSPAGESLMFSLILRLGIAETRSIGLFTALGALAVAQAIRELDGDLDPKIKWPNDILLMDQKVCGILVETSWIGDQIESLVLGIGVNVTKGSVPPDDAVSIPGTCLENLSYRKIDRLDLLQRILKAVIDWRKRMDSVSFIETWQNKLAYKGEMVQIWSEKVQPRVGIITGLDPDGGLRLLEPNGKIFTTHFGEVHLKPIRL